MIFLAPCIRALTSAGGGRKKRSRRSRRSVNTNNDKDANDNENNEVERGGIEREVEEGGRTTTSSK